MSKFIGLMLNSNANPIIFVEATLYWGKWRQNQEPSRTPWIVHGGNGEWRSETKDAALTGTSGFAIWKTDVTNPTGTHTEFIKVEWDVPLLGEPYLSWGITRGHPHSGLQGSGEPPDLELSIRNIEADGSTMATVASVVAPFVFAMFGLGKTVHTLAVQFELEQRIADTPVRFPTASPTPEMAAMQRFRELAILAPQMGFAGAFPNFYTTPAPGGLGTLGGTIFVTRAEAEWRDVPLGELDAVDLDSFGDRMKATDVYAKKHGYRGGFPTFWHNDKYAGDIRCGTILLRNDGAEWQDVDTRDLGNPSLSDIAARFKGTQDYANGNGFVGGFPNFFHGQVNVFSSGLRPMRRTVCGTTLLRSSFFDFQTGRKERAAEWRNI